MIGFVAGVKLKPKQRESTGKSREGERERGKAQRVERKKTNLNIARKTCAKPLLIIFPPFLSLFYLQLRYQLQIQNNIYCILYNIVLRVVSRTISISISHFGHDIL